MSQPLEAGEGVVHAEYHSFLLCDVGAFVSMPPADTNGLVVTAPGIAFIRTGIHTGKVNIRGEVYSHAPALDLDSWEEVVEVSLEASTEGHVIACGLGSDGPPELPVLSPQGRGHYRLRIHARGRDTAVDMTTPEPVESYLVQSWPAPPAPEVGYKHTDSYGAELRRRSQSAQ
jgi:hypothetical protein